MRGAGSRTAGVVAVLLGLLAWGAFAAPAASAHNVLRGTDPADGATLDVAPDRVTLTFDQPALALGTQIVVEAPDGRQVSAGEAELVDATVSERLAGDLPAGDYVVEWRVTSADGHPVSGTFRFTARAATTVDVPSGAQARPGGQDEPAPSATATRSGPAPDATAVPGTARGPGDGSGGPATGLLIGIGAAVFVVVLGGWLLATRPRRPRTDT